MRTSKSHKVALKHRTRTKPHPRTGLAHKPLRTISATQAARTFADLLNRVRYHGEAFVIERGGEPMCEISPCKPPSCTGVELLALLQALPKPDRDFWDAVEKASRQTPAVPESPWEHCSIPAP